MAVLPKGAENKVSYRKENCTTSELYNELKPSEDRPNFKPSKIAEKTASLFAFTGLPRPSRVHYASETTWAYFKFSHITNIYKLHVTIFNKNKHSYKGYYIFFMFFENQVNQDTISPLLKTSYNSFFTLTTLSSDSQSTTDWIVLRLVCHFIINIFLILRSK